MLDMEIKFQRYKAEVTSQECFWRMTYFPFPSFFAVLLHEQQLSSLFLKLREGSSEDQTPTTEMLVMKMASSLQIKCS